MKIVLVRPNFGGHIVVPPLGLGYIASFLKKNGIEAVILDALKDNLSNEKLVSMLKEQKPDAVGIHCLTSFYDEVVSLTHLLKENGLLCIIGGSHPTFLPHQTLLETGADYVICGEGEIPFLELAKNNFKNEGIQGVYSLGNIKNDEDFFLKARVVEALDDLPFPDWAQMNPNIYPKTPLGAFAKDFPIGQVSSSRGCPYYCAFCSTPNFYDKRVRFRSPENVVEEIKYLIENFNIKELQFTDDNLILNREHAVKIFNLMLENNIKINWSCPVGIRADKLDKELAELMSKSGCYLIAMGVESSSSEILKNAKKGETFEQIKNAIDVAHNAEIICQGCFVFGLPGETADTINKTIEFAKQSKLSRAQFTVLNIIPGCDFWKTLKGHFTPDFSKKSFREPDWIPEGLTAKQILDAQSRAFRAFYFRPNVLLKLLISAKLTQFKFMIKRLLAFGVFKR